MIGTEFLNALFPHGEQLEAGLKVRMPCSHTKQTLGVEILDNGLMTVAQTLETAYGSGFRSDPAQDEDEPQEHGEDSEEKARADDGETVFREFVVTNWFSNEVIHGVEVVFVESDEGPDKDTPEDGQSDQPGDPRG